MGPFMVEGHAPAKLDSLVEKGKGLGDFLYEEAMVKIDKAYLCTVDLKTVRSYLTPL